jgi:hypothetical protein
VLARERPPEEVLMLDRLLPAFVAAALFAPMALEADEKADDKPVDRTPVDCIVVSRIDKTDVIDDQTVLFFMRGNKIYRNYLPRKCPGLEVEDRFGYQVRSSRLCKVDLLTVLPRVGIPTTCRFGEFLPITREEAEDLRALHDHPRHGDGVDVKPVEPSKKPAAEAGDNAEEHEAPARE